jgi:signal transduction histidine kinase
MLTCPHRSPCSPLRAQSGAIVGWPGTTAGVGGRKRPNGRIVRPHRLKTGVDERERAGVLLAGERQLLEMMASGCSLPTLLEALCRAVEQTASGNLCSVVLIEPGGATIQQAIGPSVPRGYTAAFPGRPVPCEGDPCTAAVSRRTPVIVTDVASDGRWDASGWRAHALSHGLRSCWATPILSRVQHVLGVLAVYRRRPGVPSPEQQDHFARFTRIASIAIERAQTEDALASVRSELAHLARVATLGALTASITHEVSQPLSGIVTNASTCARMLAADPPDVAGARETARRTIRDADRASAVIARLRALFNKDTRTEPIDLNEATREMIAMSLSELQRGRVLLRTELADDLPPVRGDRVQLQQVVLNLLLNAAEAMGGVDDRPRELVVATERDDGGRVRLTVRDAGVGVEPHAVHRLFDAFYTTKAGGMGIGLSVSRSIIESHRGRIWATPNQGPGASFSFSIPGALEAMPAPDGRGALPASVETEVAR